MRLFEFGDLKEMPSLYHLYLRRYLVFFYKVFGYYKLWVPAFSDFLEETKAEKIMECCSGAGEALELLESQLDSTQFNSVHYLLSDIQPRFEFVSKFNLEKEGRFHYIAESVDVTQLKVDLDCPKVFINSFHHFSQPQVENIFKSVLGNGNEILILEYVRNSLLGYLSMLMGPIVVLLTLPFVVKPKHFPIMALFTYLVPLFPLMVLWDGMVSCMHEYNAKQLRGIATGLGMEVTVKSSVTRSLFYPAGVSAIVIMNADCQ